jgi:hypothetical protein
MPGTAAVMATLTYKRGRKSLYGSWVTGNIFFLKKITVFDSNSAICAEKDYIDLREKCQFLSQNQRK